MYVFQMNDGRWWMAHRTNAPLPRLAYRSLAFALYDSGYDTRSGAEAAMSAILHGFGL